MIYCVGAGPGDLGYMTQYGRKLIEEEDAACRIREPSQVCLERRYEAPTI